MIETNYAKKTFSPLSDKILIFYQQQQKKEDRENKYLRLGVWAYFLLLIFEGGLRKWVFPALATPLLVIRDPIAIWLIFKTWQQGKMQINFYITVIVAIGIISIFTSYFFGHGNIYVALFGARILLIHFPLIFVIGQVFNREDVIKLGKVTLWLAIPMIVLVAVQFYSPQSAFVNQGVGGDEGGAGFSGALGFFRPPGTFSFTNGNSLFFSFLASYVLFFWVSEIRINKFILIAATFSVIAAIPLSISRTLFFSVGVALIFTLVAASRKPQYFSKIIGALLGIGIAVLVLSQTAMFQTAINVFMTRFTIANENEGGVQSVILDRYLGGLIEALGNTSQIPYFGYGVGMGTNVGAVLLTGKQSFLISEGEWGRLIGELGALLGIIVIIIRMSFSIDIMIVAYKQLLRNNLLPWLLLSFALLNIPQGQWGQATSLGFSTLIGGLLLASLKPSGQTNN